MTLLTNLIFEPKGKHDPALAYAVKDTVMSADGSRVYFALKDVPAGVALNNEDYWKLQIDLSGSKNAMDDALASFGDYAKAIGTRVKGETAKASGNPVTFLPDADSLLMPVTVLEPQQEGSGDPSPDNVRPFIGYDKLALNAAGKNLVEQVLYGYVSTNSFRVDNATTSAVLWIVEGQTYKISCASTLNRLTIGKSETYNVAHNTPLTNVKQYSQTNWTFTAEFTGIAVIFLKSSKDETLKDSLQIEIGSESSVFEPYRGNNYAVQIDHTVYGGRFDWLTGKGLIEWDFTELDGTEAMSLYASPSGGNSVFVRNVLSESLHRAEGFCSHFPIHNYIDTPGTVVVGNETKDLIFVGVIDVLGLENTTAAFAAYLAAQKAAGTPVQIAYKLATPIEIQIQLVPAIISAADPEQTNTLYGDGSIEVEYVKPLHVSIEERVAAAVAAALQTQ